MFLNYHSFNDPTKLICLLYLKKWSFLRENASRVEDAVSSIVKVQQSYIFLIGTTELYQSHGFKLYCMGLGVGVRCGYMSTSLICHTLKFRIHIYIYICVCVCVCVCVLIGK